jgi:hypothetical protein
MQGYRFFEEYTDDRRAQSAGNVIAIHIDGDSFVQEGGICYGALCADDESTPVRNAPILARLFNAEYLGTHCRRISEARARVIHPKLFEYLDSLA